MKRTILTCLLSLIALSVLLSFPAIAEDFFLKQILLEGESRDYNVGGYVYEIELVSVFDSQRKAQFRINEEMTKVMQEDEMYLLRDGASIQVRDVMPQEAGDGRDLVQFNFFPVSHPEAAAGQESESGADEAAVAAPPETEVTSAEPEETTLEVHAVDDAEEQEAVIDITKMEHTQSWWESLIEWLKDLFS